MDCDSNVFECNDNFIINDLCSEERINDEKIAEKLHILVKEGVLNEGKVIQYLYQQPRQERLHSIFEHFCFMDNAYLRKRKKPQSASASDWSNNELDFYNVVIIDVVLNDIVHMPSSLSAKSMKFIEDNKHLTPSTFVGKKNLSDITANTEFQQHMLLVSKNPSRESCVDNMFICFMRSVLDNEFLVEGKYDMKLTVSNIEKKATADIVAILFPHIHIGVIVVEDKSKETSKTKVQQVNAEAQLIAEGIAIAQQKRWPQNMPIFMIKVAGTYVSLYKTIFTKEFVNSVKCGIKRNIPFKILRYSSEDPIFEGRASGCDLQDPIERELLVKALYGIWVVPFEGGQSIFFIIK